jgi:hypothetical protein
MENALLSVYVCTPQKFEQMEAIAEEYDCAITAASRFTIDGVRYAYFEIASDGANLNLEATVNAARNRIVGAALLGGYRKTSIVTLVNQQ